MWLKISLFIIVTQNYLYEYYTFETLFNSFLYFQIMTLYTQDTCLPSSRSCNPKIKLIHKPFLHPKRRFQSRLLGRRHCKWVVHRSHPFQISLSCVSNITISQARNTENTTLLESSEFFIPTFNLKVARLWSSWKLIYIWPAKLLTFWEWSLLLNL